MKLPQLCAFFLACQLPVLHAESLAPLVDLLPECKQAEVVPLKTVLKVRNHNLWRFALLRDVPEVARYLQQIRENATARRFDAVLVQKIKQSEHKLPGNYSEVLVQLELFRFCEGNNALSDKSADISAARQIKIDLGSTQIRTAVTTVIKRQDTEEYRVIVPPNHHLSLQGGAFGLKLKMTAEQVFTLWGSPSADLTLTDGARLLGYGRRLWVYLDPLVKAVFTDSEILSGVGRNLLEFHPEFDDKPWLVEGKVAYKTDMAQAAGKLGSWHKVTPLIWRKQQPGQQLKLQFEEFNPESVHQTTAMLTGFYYSSAATLPAQMILQQQPWQDVLAFAESVSVRNLQQQPAASLFPPHLRLHQLVQRRNQGWWLPTSQLHVMVVKDEIRRIKLTAPVMRKSDQPNQIPALLKALQIPVTKAGLRLAFPDMQDIGDRFQLYRDDYDILIEFSSDEEQAEIEELEIMYHFT
ncbi:hypothetical protein [Rheinheimera texasensis]|uniref:hypothetical protein n=1 Tax=Rheinheimera texasensis TaxID=306205 RepID=UPI0004E1E10B|nr:hypothetical protein [Rheinheimera texasensis]